MKITLIKFILGVIFFCGLSLLIYLIYPNPIFFWRIWHRQDIRHINELSQKLGISHKLDENIRCWEATNSRCGIVLVFTTNLDLENFKAKVDALNYEQKLSRDIDGYGLITVIDFNTRRNLSVNGISDLISVRNTAKSPSGWGWWIIDDKEKSMNINYFKPHPDDIYKIDNNNLNGNVVEITYYTRGR